MTITEMLDIIIAKGEITDEMVEMATSMKEKREARSASQARAKAEKKAEVDAPIVTAITAILIDKEDYVICGDIKKALDESGVKIRVSKDEEKEITVSKVSSVCKAMVESDVLVREEIKVKGRGKVWGYKLA